jgi:hypothetical protein
MFDIKINDQSRQQKGKRHSDKAQPLSFLFLFYILYVNEGNMLHTFEMNTFRIVYSKCIQIYLVLS